MGFRLKATRKFFAAMAFVGLFGSASASAAPITIDQNLFDYLFDPEISAPSVLMILADMGPAGDALRMALAQVSCDIAKSEADSGAPDSASEDDVWPDWECETSSSTSMPSRLSRRNGHGFLGSAGGMSSGGRGSASPGSAVGALQSTVTDSFIDDSIAQPPNAGGPAVDPSGGFGPMSGLETGTLGNAPQSIRNDYLTLALSITVPDLAQIHSSDVSVPFDSPNPPIAKVPEPSTLLLSALAIAGFGLMRRRRPQQPKS